MIKCALAQYNYVKENVLAELIHKLLHLETFTKCFIVILENMQYDCDDRQHILSEKFKVLIHID